MGQSTPRSSLHFLPTGKEKRRRSSTCAVRKATSGCFREEGSLLRLCTMRLTSTFHWSMKRLQRSVRVLMRERQAELDLPDQHRAEP